MHKDQSLCVAYATDDNYAKYLGISMLSLFDSNKKAESIEVFVLDCGVGPENRESLEQIAGQYERTILFLPMESAIQKLPLKMGTHKIAIASYARLFLSSILPDRYERIFYLDCDTLITDSLLEIWQTEMEGFYAAGVQDTVDEYFLHVIGLEKNEPYINAGVLLINLKAWRADGLEKQFLDFITARGGNVPHHDQGTINAVCKHHKKVLPPQYNLTSNLYVFSSGTIRSIYGMAHFYTQKEIDQAIRKPAVIHFTTGIVGRPWEIGCTHPAKDDFIAVMQKTPWKNEPLLPDSRKKGVKVFAFSYRHMPLKLFEAIYRSFCWILHIRK